MISVQAAQAFEAICSHALRSTLCVPMSAAYGVPVLPVERAQLSDVLAEGDGPGLSVMLSIAEYGFRMAVLLHVDEGPALRSHIARGLGVDAGDLGQHELRDHVCEMANLFCGAMSRELGRVYPHLGMSTPRVLSRDVLRHLSRLPGAALELHVKARPAAGPALAASLCVAAKDRLDFAAPPLDKLDECPASTGEMELL